MSDTYNSGFPYFDNAYSSFDSHAAYPLYDATRPRTLSTSALSSGSNTMASSTYCLYPGQQNNYPSGNYTYATQDAQTYLPAPSLEPLIAPSSFNYDSNAFNPVPYSRAPTPSSMNISRSSSLASSHFPTQIPNNHAAAAQFTSSGGLNLPYSDFSTDSAYACSPLSLTFSDSHHYDPNPQTRNRTPSIVLPDLDAMSITPLKSSASSRRRRASTAKPTSVNNEYVRRLDEKFCPVSSSLIGLRRKRSLSKVSARQAGSGALPPLPPLPPLPLLQPVPSKRKPQAPANLTAAGYGPISHEMTTPQLSTPARHRELPPLPPLSMSGFQDDVRPRRSSSSIKPESPLEESSNSLQERSKTRRGSQAFSTLPGSILSLNTAEAMLEFHRQRTSSQTIEMRRSFQPTSPQRRGLSRNTSLMSGFSMPNTPPQTPLESSIGSSILDTPKMRTRAKNDQCRGN